jgi:hypothetical protein
VQAELASLADESLRAALYDVAALEDELCEREHAAAELAAALGVQWASAPAELPIEMQTESMLAAEAEAAAAAAAAEAEAAAAAAGGPPAPLRACSAREADEALAEAAGEAAGGRPAAVQPLPGMKSSERYRLLGELPELVDASRRGARRREGSSASSRGDVPRRLPARRHEPPARRGGARGAAGDRGGEGPVLEENVPEEFLCALNHHLMRKPLRSPHGHTFDAESIEAWLSSHGSVCPISGALLTFDALSVDEALKRRIQEHHIRAALTRQDKLDEESDLYTFD